MRRVIQFSNGAKYDSSHADNYSSQELIEELFDDEYMRGLDSLIDDMHIAITQ